LDKERRRRKQDCLEQVIEDLDSSRTALDDVSSMSMTVRSFVKNPNQNLRVKSLEYLGAAREKSESALEKLNRSESKLIIFGFEKCAEALNKYHGAALGFTVEVTPFNEGGDEGTFVSARERLWECAGAMRAEIGKAFETL
jgi:hypothetical protein